MKDFFKKVGLWFKTTFGKCKVWALAHKIPAIVIASSAVVAITLAIVLPVSLSGKNKNTGDRTTDNTPKNFVLNKDKSAELVQNPSKTATGSIKVFGTVKGEETSATFSLHQLTDTSYYTTEHNNPTCEKSSGDTYTFKDDAYTALLKNTYNLSDSEASTYYTQKVKPQLTTSIFIDSGANDALGHAYPLSASLVTTAGDSTKGVMRFVCANNETHVITLELPELNNVNYDINSDAGTCIEKEHDDYTLKESIINDFLDNEGADLFHDDTEKLTVTNNIVNDSKVTKITGGFNNSVHAGNVTFTTYGLVKKPQVDSEDYCSYLYEDTSYFQAFCDAGCSSPGLGNTEDFYYSDGYWKVKPDNSGLRRYFDVELNGEFYNGVASEEYYDSDFKINLHPGKEATINNDGLSTSDKMYLQMDGCSYSKIRTSSSDYCKAITLSRISNNGKTASSLADGKIKVYADGKEVDIVTTTGDYPSTPTYAVRKGAGLYIFLGNYFPDSELYNTKLWANIDICFDFE